MLTRPPPIICGVAKAENVQANAVVTPAMTPGIDNGSVDMLKAMRVYKEVGYDGMMMPDHVPQVESVDSNQGFAYAFGYIKALIAAVSAEG